MLGRRKVFLLLALAVLTPLNAWPRTLQEILNHNTLRVGVAVFTPWAARAPGGELVGFEIDVANKLAEDMGVDAVFQVYSWDRLIPALEAGEIDIIAAGMSITPERALHVNFSRPYADSGTTLATHLESTADVTSLEDLDDRAYRLAAISGSVGEELAKRIFPRAELVLFDDPDAASDALLEGGVNAYLEDEPVPTFLALEYPHDIDVPVSKPLLLTRSAFAVNKGDPDFLAFLNAWITAREADTWLPTIHGYWFKSLRWRTQLEATSSTG